MKAKNPGPAILYEGTIHRFSDPAFAEIICTVYGFLQQFPLSLNIFDSGQNQLYLRRLHLLRWKTARNPFLRETLIHSLERQGFNPGDLYLDSVRFRCIPPDFQNHPQARGLLCWHRDTYYANPACQINLWLPLTDCDRTNGMGFFLEYLDRPMPNNSSDFDLEAWNRSGGFQAFRKKGKDIRASTGLTYPSVFDPPPMEEVYSPPVKRGQALLFASRHLHGTMPNISGKNRYSLELRFFTRTDMEKADRRLNVDDKSRGCFAASFRNGADNGLCPRALWSGYQEGLRKGRNPA